jgi:hypothetical protein
VKRYGEVETIATFCAAALRTGPDRAAAQAIGEQIAAITVGWFIFELTPEPRS